jgi:hypothetical protein
MQAKIFLYTYLTNIQFPADTECARTVPYACILIRTLLTLLEEEVAPRGTPDTITHINQDASYSIQCGIERYSTVQCSIV